MQKNAREDGVALAMRLPCKMSVCIYKLFLPRFRYLIKKENNKTMNKTENILLRCSIGEKKIISELAKKCGLTLSEYCRGQALHGEIKAIPPLSQEEIEYFHLLKTYCTHFNRISSLIRKKDPGLVEEIRQLVDELTRLQRRIV